MSAGLPLPRLHPYGAAIAERRECEWWPNAFERQQDLSNLEQSKERAAPNINSLWIERARRFLVDYNVPNLANSQTSSGRDHGHISAALQRVRDDRVILDSLADVPQEVREGLEIKHRDVLAAVALLSKVDTTAEGVAFRPGALEPATVTAG